MGNRDKGSDKNVKKPKKDQKPKVTTTVVQPPMVVDVVKKPRRGRESDADGS